MMQILAYGIITGSFYGLAAVGLCLIFGVMKHLNIAHGSFLMLGGYVAYWLLDLFKLDPIYATPLAMIALFIIGAALYKGLFSHLEGLPEGQKIDNSLLVGFGLTWVIDNLATLLWTADVRAVTPWYVGKVWKVFPGLRLPYVGMGIVVLALVVITSLYLLLRKTYFGKSVRGTAQDKDAANIMGIDVERTYLVFFGIGSALAGIAGVAAAVNYSVHPAAGFDWLLKATVVFILAGVGNIGRVFGAGLILGIVEGISVYLVGADYREVVGLVMFVLVLLVRSEAGRERRRFRDTLHSAFGVIRKWALVSKGGTVPAPRDRWSWKGLGILVSGKMFLLSAAVLVALAIFPLTAATDHTLNLFVTLFVIIILAQSWNLLAGYAGQVSLGNAAFFGIGVLVFYYLAWSRGLPVCLALPAAGCSGVVLASIIGLPALRFKGAYFSIGTLAMAEAVRITVTNLFPMTVYIPVAEVTSYSLVNRYYLALGVALLTQVAAFFVVKSKTGLAMMALRDDEEAADTTGVNLFKYKYAALVFSSFFCGLAGGVFAYYQASIIPAFAFSPQWTFEPLVAAAVGGAGTLLGPVIGSAFLILLMEVFALVVGKGYLIIFGALFILVVLFFPGGLAGALSRVRRSRRWVNQR
ncbi:MAG: hypothetical protein C4576_32645 [Desulfobacteraceae bacterium]|nr:MAG: hypothetical protein C4576_32645 [Desulfobacteraceae bacterium]